MTQERKQALCRFLIGGILCVGAATMLLCFWNRGALDALVREERVNLFGSYPVALAVQTVLLFLLGGLLGGATLPFDAIGLSLTLHSLTHFLLTGVVIALVAWDCLGADTLDQFGFVLAIYAFIYLLIWMTRYLGWRREVDSLRSALSLPPPPPSPLRWRESLPYLLLLGTLFLLLRPFAEVVDDPAVPVLRALLLPWFVYPFSAVLLGGAAGRRAGGSVLLPFTAFVSFLPNLLYANVPYDLQQAAVYALLTALAQGIGALTRRAKRSSV